MAVYRVYGKVKGSPRPEDWDLLLETEDPARATDVVHESDGTFWRRLTEDGQIVISRV